MKSDTRADALDEMIEKDCLQKKCLRVDGVSYLLSDKIEDLL